MVSARLKKRFIALTFLSSIAVVFLYKIQQLRGSDYIAAGFKQTKDFSSIIHDRDKSNVRPRSADEREDLAEYDEVTYDMENLTYQDTGINATEPPEKIHRGVEGDDEVEETLDWLQEHGATPSPDQSDSVSSPVTDIEEITTVEQASSSTQSSVPSTLPSSKQSLTSEPSSTTDAEHTTTRTKDDAATQSSAASSPPSSMQSLTSEPSSTTDAENTTTVTQDDAPTQSSPPSTLPSSTQRYGAQQNHSSLPDISSQFTTPSTTGLPTPIYTTSPNLNSCKLPNLDPWDPSISHLLKDVGNDPGCRGGYPLPAFDVKDNRLILTGEVNASLIDFSEVNVETIHRDNGDDGYVHYANQGNPFNASAERFQPSNVINKSDFFVLKYKLSSGKEVTNYLARAVPQQDVIDESSRMRQKLRQQGKNKGLGLNVVMLGFDSVSAANFRRKMPKSINFLKRSLKTYFISGQTIVGDATTPALTAMLTGLYEKETPEGRQGYDNSATIDKWPWIMNLYKEHGYVTMMGEDDPTMGAFNLRLRGFEDPPAHHYARPFWLALEERYERDEPGLCSRSTFMVNYTLDYILSYFEAYPSTPKFAFAFMSYLTHAHPNHLSYADNDIVRLLRTFVDRKYHDNTVIILFGDHGSRNDDVRNTMQGKLEERLPWLSISVPAWLEKKYPDLTSALEHNQHIISSPFDVHATLRHVLTYPEEPRGEKTQSLFRKLNYTRTCSEAGVGEHWCPCLEFTDVDPTHPEVIAGAQMAVKYINDVILNRTKLLRTSCARVQLKKILKASSYKPNEKLQRFSSTNQDSDRAVNFGLPTSDSLHYRINFMTSPGDALFEATVTIREDYNVIVNPNLSRTNLYGNQPRCILRKEPYARKFCYCKELEH